MVLVERIRAVVMLQRVVRGRVLPAVRLDERGADLGEEWVLGLENHHA